VASHADEGAWEENRASARRDLTGDRGEGSLESKDGVAGSLASVHQDRSGGGLGRE